MTASAGRSQNQVPVVDRVDQQPVWSFVRSAFFVEVLQQGTGGIIALLAEIFPLAMSLASCIAASVSALKRG